MKKIIGYVVALAVLVIVYLIGHHGSNIGLSSTDYNSLNVTPSASTGDTYAYAVNGTAIVDMSGVYVGTVSSTASNVSSLTIGSGTAITKYFCATVSWNPGALTSSTVPGNATTTDIALTGAALGDTCSASLTSATSTGLHVGCNIASAATGTIQLMNISDAALALDAATGTAKVCYTH